MILADTSAWVEYERGTRGDVDRRIAELIGSEGPLAVTEPVVMEVVAGARSTSGKPTYVACSAGVTSSASMPSPTSTLRVASIDSVVALGVTPRGLVDCMIASVAHRHGASLLAHDTDLSRVATAIGIELDRASLSL